MEGQLLRLSEQVYHALVHILNRHSQLRRAFRKVQWSGNLHLPQTY